MELLSAGTSANLSDDKGRSGLHFAASQGNEAMGMGCMVALSVLWHVLRKT
jgi:ankyrin repeat protein